MKGEHAEAAPGRTVTNRHGLPITEEIADHELDPNARRHEEAAAAAGLAPGETVTPRSNRQRVSELLATRPLRRLARATRWPGVLIFNYHRVGTSAGTPWDHTLYNADEPTFESQIAALSRSADIVSVADLHELARRGRSGRHVLLTFDDGYRDNYEIAYPILRRHSASATFFVSTGFLDRPRVPWWDEIAWMVREGERTGLSGIPHPESRLSCAPGEIEQTIAVLVAHYKTLPGEETEAYLDRISEASGSGRADESVARGLFVNWDLVREMRAGGMDIGGHTVTHPILSSLDEPDQAREIEDCADRLREELDEPMRWFAYPVGAQASFTHTTETLLAARSVELAFSFYGGFARFDDWRPMDRPRMHVPYNASPELMEAMVALPGVFAQERMRRPLSWS